MIWLGPRKRFHNLTRRTRMPDLVALRGGSDDLAGRLGQEVTRQGALSTIQPGNQSKGRKQSLTLLEKNGEKSGF